MKLIDKYLLRECLLPYAYCILGLAMLLVLGDLFERQEQFREAGTPVWDVILFYGHYLAAYAQGSTISSMVMVLPISLLAGTLYSLTRLTRQNELTAMRASGVSLYRLMAPFLCLGIVSSMTGAALQELAAPGATRWIMRYDDLLDGDPIHQDRTIHDFKYYDQETRTLWEVGSFNLSHPDHLWDVQVTREREDRTREETIIADRALWKQGKWWFYGKQVQEYSTDDEPDGPKSSREQGPVHVSGLRGTPSAFALEADTDEVELYASSRVLLRYLAGQRGLPPVELARKRVDAHLRLSMPWVCVVASIIAIPAAARSGRRGAFAGINLAVLMFLGFYMSVQIFSILAKRQLVEPWVSAWLPNITFLAVGAGIFSRMR